MSLDQKIIIESYCDGWSVDLNGKSFRYGHNDGDLGAATLKEVLEEVGFADVVVEEVY